MARLMISISGVRGVVGDGLTPEVALQFGQAFGTYCENGTVIVGRDSRISGTMMHHAIISGLIAVGNRVVDIGLCPTPTTQIATEKLSAAGGIMITASHNPIMWNGIKMLAGDGLFLDAEQGESVLQIRNQGSHAFKAWDKIGTIEAYDKAVDDHLRMVLALPYINISQIRARKFKVVADCINGAGAVIVPRLLQELGCDLVVLNGTPDGKFTRAPEPLPENLFEVKRAMSRYNADIGVVVDPDSDRLALVSEKGEPLGEEYTLALAADHILKRKKGTVVVNVSTSRAIDDIARKHDCRVERTRVGEINVAKHMRAISAVFGGEGNGGVILPEVHLGRDAIVGIAVVLQKLAETRQPLSAVHAELPQYKMVKHKIDLAADADPLQIVKTLTQKYKKDELDLTDGLKILRGRTWVQVRASNTEPIIRVMAEAPTQEQAVDLVDELAQATLAV